MAFTLHKCTFVLAVLFASSLHLINAAQGCTGTGNPSPIFDSQLTFFANDNLTLTVNMAGNPNRTDTQIAIGNSSNPACTFPGTYAATAFVAGCVETFQIIMPWADHSLCLFTEDDSNPDTLIFSAHVFVTTTTTVGEMRGRPLTKVETNSLDISVSFPKKVSVSANIKVAAPVALETQVTRQSFNPSAKTGSATFVTSLQWPFELQGGLISTSPSGITANSLTDATTTGDCASTSGSVCFQTFSFNIVPSASHCVLDGDYQVQFQVACRGSDQCAFDGTTYNVNATLTLKSADFCASLSQSVAVTATLTPYADSTKALRKTSYVINQNSFFEVVVSSPNSPLASITLASILVGMSGQQGTEMLTNVTSVTNGVSSASFVLLFDPAHFVIPADEILVFEVTTTVDLVFSSNQKRRVTSTRALKANTAANSTVSISAAPTPAPSTPAPSSAPTQAPSEATPVPSNASPTLAPAPSNPSGHNKHSSANKLTSAMGIAFVVCILFSL